MKSTFRNLALALLVLAPISSHAITEADRAIVRGGAFNSLKNPGFEGGRGDYTVSGATVAVVTSGSNLLFGKGSVTFTPSASGQYIQSSLYTIPVGLYGGKCMARVWYKGGDASNKIQVLDGSDALIVERQFTGDTGKAEPLAVNFVCPSSGSYRLRIVSTQSASIVALDGAHLGEADNFTQVSQASLYGAAIWPATANCQWSTSSTSYAAFTADSDCTLPVGSNLIGAASAPATKIPAITFAYLPPGEYELVAVAGFGKGTAASEAANFRFFDGTSDAAGENTVSSGTNVPVSPAIYGRFKYDTAQTNITFQIRGKVSVGSATADVYANTTSLYISVKRLPSSTLDAFSPSTLTWKVDATIAGANPSLGTSAVTSYTGVEDAGLTLTNNVGQGNILAQIPCSSTNAPTGTTCAAGSESVGVSFVLPAANSDVMACASFGWVGTTGSTLNNFVSTTFQLVETPNNAQTILQEGKSKPQGTVSTPAAASATATMPFRVCGNFSFASAGQKTIRLMFEQAGTGISGSSIYGDANTNLGQRDIHWEVYPMNQGVPAPILYGPFRTQRTVTASSYTAASSDETIFADGTSNSITINLPTAVGISGKRYTVVKTDSTTAIISVTPFGAETLNGGAQTVLHRQRESVTVESDGAGWFVVGDDYRIETAVVLPATGPACSVTSQSGTWIGTTSSAATGRCTIPFRSGIFSAAPQCTTSPANTSSGETGIFSSPSTSSIEVYAGNSSGTLVNQPIVIFCRGKR